MLVQFGINKHLLIFFKDHKLHSLYGLMQFCWSLLKFTCVYLFQIALEILWLPRQIFLWISWDNLVLSSFTNCLQNNAFEAKEVIPSNTKWCHCKWKHILTYNKWFLCSEVQIFWTTRPASLHHLCHLIFWILCKNFPCCFWILIALCHHPIRF